MSKGKTLKVTLRSQVFRRDRRMRHYWQGVEKKAALRADRTALLLCDVWDKHTQRGAEERLDAMVPRMNRLVKHLRARGVLIIHSPSDVVDFYRDHPARRRVLETPKIKPREIKHDDPQMPFPRESWVSDTPTADRWKEGDPDPWTREHPGIDIRDEDAISADGVEVYSLLKHHGIRHLLLMGVHTNYCILHRSFSIKQMVRWGVNIILIRDLTDAIFSPAKPPYVSHDEGTQLVIGYIEKFWCPTVASRELLKP